MTLILANRPPQAAAVDQLHDALILSITLENREHYAASGAGSRSTLSLEEGLSLASGNARITIRCHDGTDYTQLSLPKDLTLYMEIGAPKAGIGLPVPALSVPWRDIAQEIAVHGAWTAQVVSPSNTAVTADPLAAYNVRINVDFGTPRIKGKSPLRYTGSAWRFYTAANHGNFRIHRMPESEHVGDNLFYVELSESLDEAAGFEGVNVYIRGEVYEQLHDDKSNPYTFSVYSQLAYHVVYAVLEKVARSVDSSFVPDLAIKILRCLYNDPGLTSDIAADRLKDFKDDPRDIQTRIQSLASALTAVRNTLEYREDDSE